MKYEVGDLIYQVNLKNIQSFYLVIGTHGQEVISGVRTGVYDLLDPTTATIEKAYSYYVEDNNWEVINAEGL
jgi:hypothetical protein